MRFGAISTICPNLIFRIERFASSFVVNKFNACKQSLAAYFADKRMIQKFVQATEKMRPIDRTWSMILSSSQMLNASRATAAETG